MGKDLKRVWFSSGIHHHYGEEKFLPECSEAWFRQALAATHTELSDEIIDVMFNPNTFLRRMTAEDGVDLVLCSAGNY